MIAVVVLIIALLIVGLFLLTGFIGRSLYQTAADATVRLHEARTRLAVAQSKAEIRATSARLRRELDREMWWAEQKEDSDDQ